jgi:hypothetical protein
VKRDGWTIQRHVQTRAVRLVPGSPPDSRPVGVRGVDLMRELIERREGRHTPPNGCCPHCRSERRVWFSRSGPTGVVAPDRGQELVRRAGVRVPGLRVGRGPMNCPICGEPYGECDPGAVKGWEFSVLYYGQMAAHIELAMAWIKARRDGDPKAIDPWVTADLVLIALHQVAAQLRIDAAGQERKRRRKPCACGAEYAHDCPI